MNELQITPTAGAPAGHPFLELQVRSRLGLNKDDMRALRKKELGPEDWTIYKKRLYLSEAAVSRLAICAEAPLSQKCAKRQEGPNADDFDTIKREVEQLLVIRTQLKNPRIVLACPADDNPGRPKRLYRLRIRPGLEIKPKMVVSACRVTGYTDLYQFVGRIAYGSNRPVIPTP